MVNTSNCLWCARYLLTPTRSTNNTWLSLGCFSVSVTKLQPDISAALVCGPISHHWLLFHILTAFPFTIIHKTALLSNNVYLYTSILLKLNTVCTRFSSARRSPCEFNTCCCLYYQCITERKFYYIDRLETLNWKEFFWVLTLTRLERSGSRSRAWQLGITLCWLKAYWTV